jgi:hypothetical protein
MSKHTLVTAVRILIAVVAGFNSVHAAGSPQWRPSSEGGHILDQLVGAWEASIAGTWLISYQVDFVWHANGTYESRMTRLNGREPVWSGATRGRYTVERSVPAQFEYATAWMVRLEPRESPQQPSVATDVMNRYGLPVDRPVTVRVEYSPANLGGNFGGPTLAYDGAPGTTGFGMRRIAGR